MRSPLAADRADRDPQHLTSADLDELCLLVGPELSRRALALDWQTLLDGEPMMHDMMSSMEVDTDLAGLLGMAVLLLVIAALVKYFFR